MREYYPAALEAFDDLHERDALAVLGRVPNPAEGARLTHPAIRSTLAKAGRHRNLDNRASQIQIALWRQQLTAADPVAKAYAATTKAAVGIIAELNRQNRRSRNPADREFLSSTRTPTSTSPCQVLVICSAPGYSASSGTTRTGMPVPSLARTMPARHR